VIAELIAGDTHGGTGGNPITAASPSPELGT
jgi:hypothetical protein